MGILIRIGGLKIGSSRSVGIPAALKAKFLFWGKVTEIVGGQMPNKVTGSSDYLTITGTGLDARYRTPDAAAYRSADTDNCWWKTDASESTCDGNRLIAYDFARTLVKYDNTSPYTIREIIILKAGETLTTAEMNTMRDYMDLSIWWSGTLSSHGAIKGNKPIAQKYTWTAEVVSDTDADAYIARMTTPPPAGLNTLLQSLFIDLKAAGVYTELDQYVLMNLHDAQASRLDLKSDTLNHTWVGSPTWAAKVGVTIATGKYVNSNFNPVVNATKFTLNDCGIVFTQTGVAGAGYEGVYTLFNDTSLKMITVCNFDSKAAQRISQDNATKFTKELIAGFNYWARVSNSQVTIRTDNAEETLSANSLALPGHASYATKYYIGACLNWSESDPTTYTAEGEKVGSVYAQHGFASKMDATKRAAFQTIIDQFNIDIQTAF